MADKSCTTCGKTASAEAPLKCCSRCKYQLYCSVRCQRADWNVHKKIYSKVTDTDTKSSNTGSPSSTASSSSSNTSTNTNPFERPVKLIIDFPKNTLDRMANRTWLHDLPKKEV
ncbi:hypothetical protein BDV19DRAFT_392117 [Aspergillus venezuelensis]